MGSGTLAPQSHAGVGLGNLAQAAQAHQSARLQRKRSPMPPHGAPRTCQKASTVAKRPRHMVPSYQLPEAWYFFPFFWHQKAHGLLSGVRFGPSTS